VTHCSKIIMVDKLVQMQLILFTQYCYVTTLKWCYLHFNCDSILNLCIRVNSHNVNKVLPLEVNLNLLQVKWFTFGILLSVSSTAAAGVYHQQQQQQQ
jgi:hypothetical protein